MLPVIGLFCGRVVKVSQLSPTFGDIGSNEAGADAARRGDALHVERSPFGSETVKFAVIKPSEPTVAPVILIRETGTYEVYLRLDQLIRPLVRGERMAAGAVQQRRGAYSKQELARLFSSHFSLLVQVVRPFGRRADGSPAKDL